MGEYEDRYPEAYGRAEAPAPPVQQEDRNEARRRQGRDRLPLRGLLGGGTATGVTAPPAWQHAAREPVPTIEPTVPPSGPLSGDYRGIGPRGYVRSLQRIYEDICDRLTDHPLIDASDIEVLISGVDVTLAGSVDNRVTAGRAEAIARAVHGVKTVRNALTVRAGGGPPRAEAAAPLRRPHPSGGSR